MPDAPEENVLPPGSEIRNKMNEFEILKAIENYLDGTMTKEEKLAFEQMRKTNADLDEKVVEHHAFATQLKKHGRIRHFKQELNHIHAGLVDRNLIEPHPQSAKIVPFKKWWIRNRKVVAVAASIAGIITLMTTAILQQISPKASTDIQQLKRQVNIIANNQQAQNRKLAQLSENGKGISPNQEQLSGGTSFLIDGDGYLVTKLHVVSGASTLIVSNGNHEYVAKNIYADAANDLAILKIEDEDWKNTGILPYSLRKSATDLGEELFTLGYPRNTIVYNRGYLSASTGYNDDSLSIQLTISANPGNSGGPVLDKNGDIIGVLSARHQKADEVVYATKAVNISAAIQKLKEDTTYNNLQIPTSSNIKNLKRTDQIKKIQDCVFMVKAY